MGQEVDGESEKAEHREEGKNIRGRKEKAVWKSAVREGLTTSAVQAQALERRAG